MFNDLCEILKEFLKKVFTSRLFALAVIFTCLFSLLVSKLFDLQIVKGQQFLDNYVQKTMRTVYTAGTRGNIYDRNGNILAYNQLAYSVTLQDTGAYTKNQTRNTMLLELVQILDKHGESVQGKFEVAIDNNGDMVYTSSSEAARKRFLRDLYGRTSVDELTDSSGKYPSTVTARELFEKKKKDYEIDKLKDEKGNPLLVPDDVALKMINIRYTMSLTAYQKYETTTIASNVSDETVADVMEHMADLQGIGIEESTIRVYNDSKYFAPIIGYTGKVQEDQLEELKKIDENYQSTDIVGRIGIEETMEKELQGKKGVRNMYVDNVGRILQVEDNETQPVAGKNIYLTIDRDLQIATYNLIERQLAGILVKWLVNKDVEPSILTDPSKKEIPVKDAYYQLINNNVLSLKKIASEDASDIEKQIYSKFLISREQILNNIRTELQSEQAAVMNDLPTDLSAYMQYIYTYLSDPTVGIIMKDKIDTSSPEYLAWKDGTISLRNFIYSGIANSWIDTTKLEIKSKYSNADDSFNTLVDYVLAHLVDDTQFTKKIYRYLVNDEVVTGRELCLALYAQEVLPYDEQQIAMLTNNGDNYAFTFIVDKISKIEITPAQLALDPCTGGCVVTDVKTGEVRALVTYPSYDNNRLSGTVDATYYNQLNEDMSLPLWNNATQVKKAPGSTFKPITAIAGLEEHVISLTDTINCTGEYEEVAPPIKCWIYPGRHNNLTVEGGIMNSCNYFFAEVAHRLSTESDGTYSSEKGIAAIRKYAAMFGLDQPSGVEIAETTPEITTEAPERSAMGQGTNSYSNVQLSRYVTAIANRGTVFDLTLIDKITDSKENLLEKRQPKIHSKVEIADSTWDVVQNGMRGVVAQGSAKDIFKDLEVKIAGKTGTAQENRMKPNHAFFISYAPYDNPEICVTVNIPFGYSSSNAATVAKNVYRFYYKYTQLDQILNTGALDVSNVTVGD